MVSFSLRLIRNKQLKFLNKTKGYKYKLLFQEFFHVTTMTHLVNEFYLS